MLDAGLLAQDLVGRTSTADVVDAVLGAIVPATSPAAALFRTDDSRGVLVRLGVRGDANGTVPGSAPADVDRSWPTPDWTTIALGQPPVAYLFLKGDAHLARDVRAVIARALAAALGADASRWDAAVLERVLALSRDGVMLVTADGAVRHYGDGMARIVGWTADDVSAHGWTNLAYPDPAQRDAARGAIEALILGRPSEGTVRRLRRKDGTDARAAVWSAMVPDPRGGAPGLLGVLHDVTDAQERRARAVREESLDHLGRLAAGIAHDFNNLLGAILGSAELIELTAGAGVPPSIRDRARTITEASETGARLARQLLVLGGLASIRSQPVSLVDVVHRTLTVLRDRMRAERVHRDLPDGLPNVTADRTQLGQVALNLVTNALEASPGGQIWVSVRVEPLPAESSYRGVHAPEPGTPMLCLEVADDGPGFDDAALERGLEPFFSTKAEGHGVGLAAVRAIVGAHDAAIDLANRDGGGGRVRCWWPVDDRPEAALPELAARAPAAGRTVWIVDDNLQVLEFSRISLGHRGYAVRSFGRHADALAAASSADHPDVLVLDVVMPEGFGRDRLDELRAAGLKAPVLWTSGHTPASAGLVRAEDEGFLQKPYTGDALAGEIARLHD